MAATSEIISVIILSETCSSANRVDYVSRLRAETMNPPSTSNHNPLAQPPTDNAPEEPILKSITLYITFIYGFIYLLFEAYPISFTEERAYNLRIGALPFLSIGLGAILGSAYIFYFTETHIWPHIMQLDGFGLRSG
ncbi:hypothetical protein BJX68DRAFT_270075 [Aspergillus pseudodeflectus]|uniref:Uncharacterized protein n=1 Tax=Aspergillus pseudodeflectus TaxID=176178 RepID=A0ABR4JU70_9EURO